MILLIEKVNARFRALAPTSGQASGLSICLKMIADTLPYVSVAQVDNVDHIATAIYAVKPKKVLIQALWVSDEQWKYLRRTFPEVKFYAHIHSNAPFLACEIDAFGHINVARENGVGVVFNDGRMGDNEDVYLPNIYKDYSKTTKTTAKDQNEFNVICAGSLRPMKNHITQAMGAMHYCNTNKKRLNFYINGTRSEGGDTIKSNLRSLFRGTVHTLTDTEWHSHDQLLKTLPYYDLGMQVSLSESYNIVAGDYTVSGIPMVVSNEISWASAMCMAEPGSFISISAAIAHVMKHKEKVIMHNRSNLDMKNSYAINYWNEFYAS